MLLTPAELVALTGYRRPHLQCRELERRGWHFERTALGWPVVSRSYAEARLAGNSAPIVREGPRLSHLRLSR
jgi:hypothetical protein